MIYQEYKSIVTHNSKNYDLNKIFRIVNNKSTKLFLISKLKWILKYTDSNKTRISKSNIKYPIIIVKENNKYFVIDGIHRLQKAINQNEKLILVKRITQKELNSAKI